jgi:hypothetical protein
MPELCAGCTLGARVVFRVVGRLKVASAERWGEARKRELREKGWTMGKINGHDFLADNSDEFEEDGSRYDSVIPPELRRSHSELGGEGGGESGGGRPGANSPGLGGRPPLGEENTGFEFGFLAVDTGAEPREEAREMVLETRGRAASLEELDREDEEGGDEFDGPAAVPATSAAAPQHAIEDLQRQVRTIIDMALRVEAELKALVDAESDRGRSCQLRTQPSPAADRQSKESASDNGNSHTVAREDGKESTNGKAIAVAEAASFSRVGQAASLPQHDSGQATADGHCRNASGTQTAEAGSFSYVGQAASLPHGKAIAAEAGSFSHGRRRGPAKMTPARQDEVVHYVRAGLSIRQAAAFVGCHHTTIVKAAQRDPAFAWKLEQAETMADAMPLVRVIRASRHSWQAAAWLVKNHQPCAALRRDRAAERDAEAAESLVRIDRLVRQQAPDVDVKAVIRGDRVSVELRPRRGGTGVN